MKKLEGDLEGFVKQAENAAERIRNWVAQGEFIDIFTHNDADALSSAGIIAAALRREDARFRVRSLNRIDDFIELFNTGYVESKCIIFTDMGSGYTSELLPLLGNKSVAILDHHEPVQASLPPEWVHVNPHHYGFDGAREISASGVAYFVAKAMNPANVEYSPIAVVGALGDLQDKNTQRSLHGLNEYIVAEAVENKLLEVKDDIILYGRTFRPLHVSLAMTTSPYIPGISGNEQAAYSFLTSLGIEVKEGEQWRTLADLSEEEKKKLYNGLIEYLVSRNLPTTIANELIGKTYDLVKESVWTYLSDAREFATLLNACGKSGKAWAGILVAMGARSEALEEAQRILEEYRLSVARAMDYVSQPGVLEELSHIVVLKGGDVIDYRQVSSVASILSSSGLLPSDKPLIALANAGKTVKISARASKQLVDRGLNLGSILSRLGAQFGGKGGGHNIAAGAEIPYDHMIKFLAELDKAVGENVASSKGEVTHND
ncbi:MAG: DHH family phosphoesterase [Candidatus Caldarchaeum sp.]|nr:DHH family phosphoesterase [Candidatus Caldarchaeales archaeon]